MPLPIFYSCSRRFSAVFALFACAHASAQTDATQTLERQSDEAFRQVLQQPQNLSLWSSYSQLLVRQGNYEGGIAALERLLLEPDASPSLRVEIGVLYYRLASYSMSEAMLRKALEDARLPGDQRLLQTHCLPISPNAARSPSSAGHSPLACGARAIPCTEPTVRR